MLYRFYYIYRRTEIFTLPPDAHTPEAENYDSWKTGWNEKNVIIVDSIL